MPFLLFAVASAVVVAAAVATIVLHSAWEAVAAAVVILAGTAWLGCFIALLVSGEGASAGRSIKPH
jgi:hypothetical protein